MIAYSPSELRTLAGSQKTNPFFVSQVSAALKYAADTLEAADKALQAELARVVAQPAAVRQPLSTDEIQSLGHRQAWRYKKSSDPHHSDTYTFNLATLTNLVRAIEAKITAQGGA